MTGCEHLQCEGCGRPLPTVTVATDQVDEESIAEAIIGLARAVGLIPGHWMNAHERYFDVLPHVEALDDDPRTLFRMIEHVEELRTLLGEIASNHWRRSDAP